MQFTEFALDFFSVWYIIPKQLFMQSKENYRWPVKT